MIRNSLRYLLLTIINMRKPKEIILVINKKEKLSFMHSNILNVFSEVDKTIFYTKLRLF